MATFTIHEAKTNLSKLIARAEAGEEIVIARGKQPVATLMALKPARRRVFGAMAGQFPPIPDAFFFDPLPDDELAGSLAGAHKDPFDRIFAAQALIEDLTLVTADPAFQVFGTRTLW